jgi:hypothetical protein
MSLRECGNTWTAETLTRDAGIAGFGVDPRNDSVLLASFSQGKIKRLKRGM